MSAIKEEKAWKSLFNKSSIRCFHFMHNVRNKTSHCFSKYIKDKIKKVIEDIVKSDIVQTTIHDYNWYIHDVFCKNQDVDNNPIMMKNALAAAKTYFRNKGWHPSDALYIDAVKDLLVNMIVAFYEQKNFYIPTAAIRDYKKLKNTPGAQYYDILFKSEAGYTLRDISRAFDLMIKHGFIEVALKPVWHSKHQVLTDAEQKFKSNILSRVTHYIPSEKFILLLKNHGFTESDMHHRHSNKRIVDYMMNKATNNREDIGHSTVTIKRFDKIIDVEIDGRKAENKQLRRNKIIKNQAVIKRTNKIIKTQYSIMTGLQVDLENKTTGDINTQRVYDGWNFIVTLRSDVKKEAEYMEKLITDEIWHNFVDCLPDEERDAYYREYSLHDENGDVIMSFVRPCYDKLPPMITVTVEPDMLVRRFVDDTEHGGRYYGNPIQHLPKAIRLNAHWKSKTNRRPLAIIPEHREYYKEEDNFLYHWSPALVDYTSSIDPIPAIEIDISGCSVSILYALKGLPIPDAPYIYDPNDERRVYIKHATILCINSENPLTAFRAFKLKLRELEIYDESIILEGNDIMTYEGFLKLVDVIIEHHKSLDKSVWFDPKTWTKLNYWESQVITEVMEKLNAYQIPHVSIYDCVNVPQCYERQAECFMYEAWIKVFSRFYTFYNVLEQAPFIVVSDSKHA